MISKIIIGACSVLLAVVMCACSAQSPAPKLRPTYPNPPKMIIHVFSVDEEIGRAYKVLGEVNYSQPYSAEAVDESETKERLIKIGLKRWPDSMDALIEEKSEVSPDGSSVSVSAKAIEFPPRSFK